MIGANFCSLGNDRQLDTAINDLDACLNGKFVSPSRRKQIATQLLAHVGDMKLHQRLTRSGLERKAQRVFADFIESTRRYTLAHRALEKLDFPRTKEALMQTLEQAPEQGLLTLQELGAIDEFDRAGRVSRGLAHTDILSAHPDLGRMNVVQVRARGFCTMINELYSEQMPNKRSGDLLFLSNRRRRLFVDRKARGSTAIRERFFGRHGYAHAALVQHDDVNKDPQTNELLIDGCESQPLMDTEALCDAYRLKASALLTRAGRTAAAIAYADEVDQRVQELYHDVQSELNEALIEGECGPKFSNPSKRWYSLALQSLLPAGHHRMLKNNFALVSERILAPKHGQVQNALCSEYVAMVLITALGEVERRLREAAGVKGEEPLITVPISTHENLHTLFPERLFTVLHRKGCLERIPLPGVLGRLIKEPQS